MHLRSCAIAQRGRLGSLENWGLRRHLLQLLLSRTQTLMCERPQREHWAQCQSQALRTWSPLRPCCETSMPTCVPQQYEPCSNCRRTQECTLPASRVFF
mmetsp:Transcript_67507/g.197489  ORF Transcript_67507/g.197489 Transcript_67507/m.197489 type:complete len:99 (+) Transcript_67507:1625-1921(+)